MNPRGAAGRPSERSSFLGHPGAKFLAKNERELRTREKPRPGGTYALSIGRFTGRGSGGGMNRTHRAGSQKSGSRQSASHIVLGIAMMARETWTSQTEDSFHLSRGYVQGKQFSHEPQIDDAPVNLWKAFLNMPTFHPASINPRGSLRCHRRLMVDVQSRMESAWRSCGMLCYDLHGRMQQILGGTGQDGTSFDDFDPRSRTGSCTSFQLLIGEARQSSHVAPVGTGQVTSVGAGQPLTDDRGYGRLQGGGADMNPSLEVARAGLEHHARLMAMGSHSGQHIGPEMIHSARIIPLDGRPHLGQGLHQWLGDTRGHWDGDTLVIETTNFTDMFMFAAQGASADMKLTERFTRTSDDTLTYRFTVAAGKLQPISTVAVTPPEVSIGSTP